MAPTRLTVLWNAALIAAVILPYLPLSLVLRVRFFFFFF